ncbi:opticin [Denticeps clupeoides]|uniref:LRRNT domain-containing protein n=1 Tax=Denticeps clupeoides TaxID=299321 RepID=A0AAY4DZY8_9TELE|nr:epiphycan-like [Denticeps clupeoides]
MVLLVALLAAATLLKSCQAAPTVGSDPEIYEIDSWNLNSYDYDDLDEDVKVGTVSPLRVATAPNTITTFSTSEEMTLPPQAIRKPTVPTLDFGGPGLFGPDTALGMPTCLLCVCLSGSVYCDDSDLEHVPPLPKDTTHFYARFNRIKEVKASAFRNMNQMRRIDLTGNQISALDKDAFRSLPHLQDLLLPDNQLQALPELPPTLRHVDIRNNRLKSSGMHAEGFKDMNQLEFLYLSNNQLDYIPTPLPETLRVLHLQNNNIQSLHEDTFCTRHDIRYIRQPLEDIRLDGNPLDLNRFPQAYVCLPRLPVGGTQ